MAKKSKIVEIKAQTEPQRGVGPDADPSDPVLIMYPRGASEEIIGSLAGGDEDEAVIKTAGCIVPGDITVRYTDPLKYSTITISNNSTVVDDYLIEIENGAFIDIVNKNIRYDGFQLNINNHQAKMIPQYDEHDQQYNVVFMIQANANTFDITINGNNVPYVSDDNAYIYNLAAESYPTSINISIEDHQ